MLRTALARFGAYSGEDAVREVQMALVDAEERLAELELPGDEGGIAIPPGINLYGPDGIPTREPTTQPHPDEIPTQPAPE